MAVADPLGLLALDQAIVWHPYEGMPSGMPQRLVESARGTRLQLVERDGTRLDVLDGMSSWWAAIHGYANPVIDEAIAGQVRKFSHVMFGGLTNEPAIRLARSLIDMAPAGLAHVFFSDSGSVAVEVAMKLAIQYWRGRGAPSKKRMMTWRGGYHGDTFGAMSVCDPDVGMHRLWGDVVADQLFLPAPPSGFAKPLDRDYMSAAEAHVEQHAGEVAALIVEPVVQGAGGMRFHNPGYLTFLREITERHGVLLILDEIATGFARTGEMFAAMHVGLTPDVMCLGKALTGGYMSLGATLCTPEVAEGISAGEVPILAHGPTFMGNALACAAANASLALLDTYDWKAMVKALEGALSAGLEPARSLSGVRDVRVLGGIGVIQLDHQVDLAKATDAALAGGVWLRPFGDLIYAMPPYIASPAEVSEIAAAMLAAARVG